MRRQEGSYIFDNQRGVILALIRDNGKYIIAELFSRKTKFFSHRIGTQVYFQIEISFEIKDVTPFDELVKEK